MEPSSVARICGACNELEGVVEHGVYQTFSDVWAREANTIRVVGYHTELFQSDDAKTLFRAVRVSLRRMRFWHRPM
jgi:hypothetical protein